MIFGIGTDIVKISRIKIAYDKYPNVFPSKILAQEELKVFNQLELQQKRIAYLAKRFAAKEAFVKALGSGFRNGITLPDIMITNDSSGKPEVNLSDKICKFLPENYEVFLSIADEMDSAIAFVIIEQG